MNNANSWFYRRATLTAFLLLFWLIMMSIAARSQGTLQAQMPEGTEPNVVTPRALVALTGGGEAWNPDGEYRIEIDSQVCSVVLITQEAIFFVVAESVRPSIAGTYPRSLLVQGPQISRFLDVIVKPYLPLLRVQGGFAVAVAGFAPPAFYTEGAPVPAGVDMSVIVSGMFAVIGQWPLGVILEREGERRDILGIVENCLLVFPCERVRFFAPVDLVGEYSIRIYYFDSISNQTQIVFAPSAPTRSKRRIRR